MAIISRETLEAMQAKLPVLIEFEGGLTHYDIVRERIETDRIILVIRKRENTPKGEGRET